MDVVWLARVQFAMTIMFHFLFPPITMGLALLITAIETARWRTGKDLYRRMSDFWLKIFAVNFVVGVASGIVMEFQFGTNWASYSRFVGDIFGAPLAAEGVIAFFLESGFLGLLLFGRNKISSFVRWLAATMVWLGSTLSAFWIIVANSWMQTPAGYRVANGRA
ncbi:MAG: cytochrome ubiquinol oxidase subunit I, partial [Thermoanaerobaculia bacterium]